MNKGTRRKFRRSLLSVLLSIGILVSAVSPLSTFAAEGDKPSHAKTRIDNHDGTYTLQLNVKGEAERIPNSANVVVVLDSSGSMDEKTGNSGEITYTPTNSDGTNLYGKVGDEYVALTRSGNWFSGYTYYYQSNGRWVEYTGQRYTRQDNGQTRMEAAADAVNALAEALLQNNTTENPTTIQIALVDFDTHATVRCNPTTDLTTFQNAVARCQAEGGTNWEAALKTAKGVSFGDTDPTYVIFVSDGNPTFRDSANGYTNDYDRDEGVYGSGQEGANNVARCYNAATDDAQAVATSPYVFYTIGAYGNVDRMEDLTTDAGAPADHYYSASNTSALQAALNAILEAIEMAGFADVKFNDGTTNEVKTSSGEVAHLLDVDETSYKYYRAGGKNDDNTEKYDSTANGGLGEEWTGEDVPAAELKDGAVIWDLSPVGVLENDVTYTVTFRVYPSQELYDLIADLKNGTQKYGDLDENVRKYLHDNGDGTYSLDTNTDATLTYTDTRNDDGPQTIDFNKLNAVPAVAQQMNVEKEWIGHYNGVEEQTEFQMTVLRDGKPMDEKITLGPDNSFKNSMYIATGLLTVDKESGKVSVLVDGHDYQLQEPQNLSYHWELQADTLHPMLINGQLTMLHKVETEDVPEGMGEADYYSDNGTEYYRIGDGIYKDAGSGAALKATNTPRSNLNLTKTVVGKYAPEDAKFTFTMKLTPPNGEDVWFSVQDADGQTVTDLFVNGATPEIKDGVSTGYYSAKSGATVTVKLQAGWNLRFTNVLTGTTYEIVETAMDDGFTYTKAEVNPAKEAEGKPQPTVTDNTKTVSGTVVQGNTTYVVTYTDTYQYAKIQIPVTKELSVPDTLTGPADISGKYTFTLTAVNGAPMPLDQDGNPQTSVTVTNPDADGGEALFDEIVFTEAGTYTYKITESGTVAGVTNDTEKTVIVTVTKNADGTLTATTDGATFTNTYAAKGTAQPEVTKTLSGRALEDGEFTFQLKDEKGAVLQEKTNANGKVVFDEIEYTEAGTYKYTITEVEGDKGGVTYDTHIVNVTVTVTDKGDGTLATAIEYSGGAAFANTYAAEGQTQLNVTKTLSGRALKSGEFSFELKDETGKVLQTKTNTADGGVAFDTINYTEAGTYKYTITEVKGELGGVTYDEHVINVTVTVVDNGDGTLTATPVYEGATAFANEYHAEGKAAPEATKVLTGKTLEDQQFTFVLKDSTGKTVETVKNDADGKISFSDLTFTEADVGKTITYTITEENGGQRIDGITYDDLEITVTVLVTDNGDGTLNVALSYSSDTQFDNKYTVDPTTFTLGASKTLATDGVATNAPDISKAYKLILKDAEGNVIDDTQKNPDGKGTPVNFKELTFTAPGTYTYTVVEEGKVDGVTNGTDTYTVVIEVTDNGDGTMTAAIKSGDQITAFTNTYAVKPTTFTLGASKTLATDGKANNAPDISKAYKLILKDAEGTVIDDTQVNPDGKGTAVNFKELTFTAPGTYTYTVVEEGKVDGVTNGTDTYTVVIEVTDDGHGNLTATVKSGSQITAFTNTYSVNPTSAQIVTGKSLEGRKLRDGEFSFQLVDAEGNVVETKTNDADGAVTFTAIGYDKPGEYVYTIREVKGTDGKITYTDSTVTATVKVEDDSHGNLTATVTYSGENVFKNTYTPDPTEANISLKKELTGRDLNAGEFSFQLKGEDGTVLQTATNDADGLINFETIEYNEAGTYTYTITEVKDDLGGVTYDTSEITVTVTVTYDEETGEFTAVVNYPADVTFENSYAADPVDAVIETTKELKGRQLNEGEFTFQLKDAEGNVVATATNGADGSVVFDAITYEEVGEYTYTIAEVKGDLGGVTYDEDVAEVTVKVTDDLEGSLVAEVVYGVKKTFTNTYEPAPVDVVLETSKTLTGRDLAEGEFSFSLLDGEGNLVETVKNDGEGKVVFSPVTIEKAGTYTYTITEVVGELGGVTYDTKTITATVTVTDDLKGNLVAEVAYDVTDGFENVYQATGSLIPEVTKTLEGKKLAEGEFTFELKDETGKVIDTKTNSADGKVVFTALNFTQEDVGKTYTYTITEVKGNEKFVTYDDHTETLTVTVEDNGDGTLNVTGTYSDGQSFTNQYVLPEYGLKLEKNATNKPADGKAYKPGETIQYEIIVTNTGEGTLTGIVVTDPLTGDKWTVDVLEPGESKTFTTSYKVTEADGKAGKVLNTATAVGTTEDPDNPTITTDADNEQPTQVPPAPPKTGDTFRMGMWIALAVAALLSAIVLFLSGRKSRGGRRLIDG